MSQSQLPSIEILVGRIKSRIRRINKTTDKEKTLYKSLDKQLNDKQIAELPVHALSQKRSLQTNRQSNNVRRNRVNNKQLVENRKNSLSVRNLQQSDEIREIPRVPHRRHEGELMKTLIYNAHYADRPLKPQKYVNYDYQYAQHEKKYQQLPCYATSAYRLRSKSVIGPTVKKDRLGYRNRSILERN